MTFSSFFDAEKILKQFMVSAVRCIMNLVNTVNFVHIQNIANIVDFNAIRYKKKYTMIRLK